MLITFVLLTCIVQGLVVVLNGQTDVELGLQSPFRVQSLLVLPDHWRGVLVPLDQATSWTKSAQGYQTVLLHLEMTS
jgi:hypothetical protein